MWLESKGFQEIVAAEEKGGKVRLQFCPPVLTPLFVVRLFSSSRWFVVLFAMHIYFTLSRHVGSFCSLDCSLKSRRFVIEASKQSISTATALQCLTSRLGTITHERIPKDMQRNRETGFKKSPFQVCV